MSRDTQAMKSATCRFNDEDLLVSAVITKKTFRFTKKQRRPKKILPQRRTVLSWLVHSGVVSEYDVIQLKSLKNDGRIIEGIITNSGIVCLCCENMLSITRFKTHAGNEFDHSCMNLILELGKPFIICQLEAWSAEYAARKAPLENGKIFQRDENDDNCGLCGNDGDLVCCDNCPSAFHLACMVEKELPPGSWYCLRCCCRICDGVLNDKDGALKCSLCKQKYHYRCMQKEIMDDSSSLDSWFCTQSCYEIYTSLQSRIGLMNHLLNELSWTLLKCIDGDYKSHSSKHFVALKAKCNSKLAVALKIMEECFHPMEDEVTKINMIPQAIYNWGSQLPRLDYSDFNTVILEEDDVIMSVACIRIHSLEVAELPFIATSNEHRGRGNCKLLVESIEKMLKSLKVENLLIASHSDLEKIWLDKFKFRHLEDDERQNLRKINLMLLPGSTWLTKSL